MPDQVVVREAYHFKKENAQGIGESADEDPKAAHQGQLVHHRHDGYKDQPAHHRIGYHIKGADSLILIARAEEDH